jgi:hypothetical protein
MRDKEELLGEVLRIPTALAIISPIVEAFALALRIAKVTDEIAVDCLPRS